MSDYISRADLYRWACQPGSEITELVIRSANYHILVQDPTHYEEDVDNFVCDNWCVALRAALNIAWETYQRTTHFTHRRNERPGSYSKPEPHLLTVSYNRGQEETAVTIIRNILREMFRGDVDHEERIM